MCHELETCLAGTRAAPPVPWHSVLVYVWHLGWADQATPAPAGNGAGRPVPLPNVNALSLARLVQFCERRVSEAAAAAQRSVAETHRLGVAAATARRLVVETGKACAAAVEREQRLAVAVAEAQRLVAEATARHDAAAGEAERLAAQAAETERLAVEAEGALQQHRWNAVTEPGALAALGGTGEVVAEWEETFIAQTGADSLLQLITVRSRMHLPHCSTAELLACQWSWALWRRRQQTISRPIACWTWRALRWPTPPKVRADAYPRTFRMESSALISSISGKQVQNPKGVA